MTGSKEEVNESEEEITEELVEEVKEILEDMGSTVNEMERAISDLKSENLRLKLDLGIKHDRDTTSVDESLRSVDEEVQEVTAVRLA